MNAQQDSIWDRHQFQEPDQTHQGKRIMNLHKRIRRAAVAVAIGLISSFTMAHADYEEPIPAIAVADHQAQVGESTEATASFAFPTVYLSAPGTGNVAGNGYADEDIMKYDSGAGTWSKAFDGTNAGLPDTADIDALTLTNNGPLIFYISFDTPVAVPGLGTVDDSDVVAYNTVAGTWTLYLDGSAHGLTTDGEDIDALTWSPGSFLVVSTTGSYSVKNLGGGTAKGKDEDLFLLVNPLTSEWTMWLDGTTIGLQGTNDINGVSFLRVNDSLVDSARYVLPRAGFTLPNGTAVGAGDVAEQVWYQNGHTDHYLKFDNNAIGFPKIDAIELVK